MAGGFGDEQITGIIEGDAQWPTSRLGEGLHVPIPETADAALVCLGDEEGVFIVKCQTVGRL